MKRFVAFGLMALLCLGAAAAEPEVEDGVLVLTTDNFDETISKNQFVLVEFYAPWCGHCKKLAPEYSKAAQALAKADPPVPLAKVDATVEKELGSKFQIQGYPTLKFFVDGKPQEYNGGRTADTIESWLLKKTGPPSKPLDCEGLKSKSESLKVLLAYFGSAEGNEFKTFERVAQGLDKVQSFHVTDAACAAEFKVTAPGLVVFRQFDEPQVVYSGAWEAKDIQKWVSGSSLPTLIEFSDDFIEPIFGQQQSAIFLFEKAGSESEAYHTAFAEAAKSLKGEVLFVYSDVSSGIQSRLGEFVGVKSKDLPALYILDPKKDMKKFKYSGDLATLTVDNIKEFVTSFKGGDLKPKLKTAEPPASNDEPVKILVGKTFNQMVYESGNDVLVEFYAPWCGHCKSLAPIYDELAKKYESVKGLTIAKIDSTENEVEDVSIQGFPTLKFFKAGEKKPMDYDGERTLDGFTKFLEKNSAALQKSADL